MFLAAEKERIEKAMRMKRNQLWICLALYVTGAAAQTPVTNGNNGTSGTLPAYTGSATLGNSPIFVSGGNVGIGTTSPAAPLHVAAGNDGTTMQGNCGAESASCPASAGVGYGFALDSDYTTGQYRWRLEPVDRGWNISLYLQESQGAANAYSNVVRFGFNQYDPNNAFAVFGNTYLGGNVGIGTTNPGAKLEVDGNVKLTANSGASLTFQDGTVQSTAYTGVLCGGDYAESMDTSGDRDKYGPGDVLVLDTGHPGKVLKSAAAYSTTVAGIYSTRPGTVGRRQTGPKKLDEAPMAMVGVVPTKVTAENGAIGVGDLLVTSQIPGYAMKGTDRSRMLGAVIGKAMGNLESGKGVIEVLVTLQ